MSFDHPMLSGICRLCTKQVSGSMKHLFQPSDERAGMSLLNRTIWVTNLEIYKEDGLPARICETCQTNVDISYKFKRQCFNSERELREFCKEIIELQTMSEEPEEVNNKTPSFLIPDTLQQVSTSIAYDTAQLLDDLEGDPQNDEEMPYLQPMFFVDPSQVKPEEKIDEDTSLSVRNSTIDSLVNAVHSQQEVVQMIPNVSDYEPSTSGSPSQLKDLRVRLERIEMPIVSDVVTKTIPMGTKMYCFTCKQCFTDSQALNMHLTKHAKCFEKLSGNSVSEKRQSVNIRDVTSGNKSQEQSTSYKHTAPKQLNSKIPQFLQKTASSAEGSKSSQGSFNLPSGIKTQAQPELLPSRSGDISVTDFISVNKLLNSYVESPSLKCTYCDRSFTRKQVLLAHVRNVHTRVFPYDCDVCGKRFAEKRGVKNHIQIKHMEKPLTCSLCPRKFLFESHLTIHMRYHNNDRPYQCSLCPKAYPVPGTLQQHLASHFRERNFHCDQCDKSFLHAASLRAHKVIHTGIKNFKCPTCDREFFNKSLLTAHKKTHGEIKLKPYRCKICYVRFNFQSNYEQHLRKHEENLLSCSVCNRTFGKRCKLRTHLFSHVNESDRPFGCDPCKKRFVHKGSLKKHNERKHPELEEVVDNVTPRSSEPEPPGQETV